MNWHGSYWPSKFYVLVSKYRGFYIFHILSKLAYWFLVFLLSKFVSTKNSKAYIKKWKIPNLLMNFSMEPFTKVRKAVLCRNYDIHFKPVIDYALLWNLQLAVIFIITLIRKYSWKEQDSVNHVLASTVLKSSPQLAICTQTILFIEIWRFDAVIEEAKSNAHALSNIEGWIGCLGEAHLTDYTESYALDSS